jgi:hypothetical protein
LASIGYLTPVRYALFSAPTTPSNCRLTFGTLVRAMPRKYPLATVGRLWNAGVPV